MKKFVMIAAMMVFGAGACVESEDAAELGSDEAIRLFDPASFTALLEQRGRGRGEFEAWARRDRALPGSDAPGPDVVVVPVCLERRVELRVMDLHTARIDVVDAHRLADE